MKKGILFVMSGPSGTGKGTICAKLLKTENIFLSVSATTREKRKGETDGITYTYISRDEFEQLVNSGEMLEYAQYNGNYYGTPKKNVENMLKSGKNVLLEIEPQGALKVKKIIPEAVLVFIMPPSMAELRKRLEERGRENLEEIQSRLDAAMWEIKQSEQYNYIVVNDDLNKCVDEVAQILHKKEDEQRFLENILNEKY